METTEKIEMHLFHSTMPSCRHIFTNGKVGNFVAGEYRTALEGEVAELKQAIKDGSQYVSYSGVLTEDQLNPLAAIKRKAVEEYIAAQAAQANPKRDMGHTESGKSIITGTVTTDKLVTSPGAGISEGAGIAVKVNLGGAK